MFPLKLCLTDDAADVFQPVIPPDSPGITLIDDSIISDSEVEITKQSTRPRKQPSWMIDFVTNAVVGSTLYPLYYPLSQSLIYVHLSSHYQSYIYAFSCISELTSYKEACRNDH